ncbi:MAG TPA: transglutaminase family protein [Xanthobacteraceae bacterium]|nr:transglutaminase family protein [Xanthobacteraceae bacterium]
MRIHVSHATSYRYDPPALGAIQVLRLTPRNHQGQYVLSWRIDVSEGCRLQAHEDAFGNLSHTFAVEGPLSELRVSVEGEVETQDTAGVVLGSVERFPPSLYLRQTELTEPGPALRGFAEQAAIGGDPLGRLHALMAELHESMSFEPDPALAVGTAAAAFAQKRGACQDFAHAYIACARHLGIPARYVSGYRLDDAPGTPSETGHAWAEAYVDGFGWVAFDCAHKLCATEAYVRVAVGLDYLGAAPVRGNRYGGGEELLSVAVAVDQSSRQIQG